MDLLQQLQTEVITCEVRKTSKINGQAEYALRQRNTVYLVGIEECDPLQAAKIRTD